jgi:hypothetical protein
MAQGAKWEWAHLENPGAFEIVQNPWEQGQKRKLFSDVDVVFCDGVFDVFFSAQHLLDFGAVPRFLRVEKEQAGLVYRHNYCNYTPLLGRCCSTNL